MLTNASVAALIPSVDLSVARAFYGGTLGLTEVDMPMPEEAPMAFYQCGQGTMLAVYERSTPTKADHTVAAFIVEDVDEAADQLISRGVTFQTYPDMEGIEWDERGVGTSGEMKSAWFSDPEGNILSIAAMP